MMAWIFSLYYQYELFSKTCSGILSSYDIPSKVKDFETSKLIHSFLDSSSINSSNSRPVILLPIYCALKQVLSSFDLVVHNQLVNQISLRILDGSPKFYQLSEIIDANSSELITYHVQDALLNGSEISTYIDSLDLELDKREIVNVPLETIGLPNVIQYDSEEDISAGKSGCKKCSPALLICTSQEPGNIFIHYSAKAIEKRLKKSRLHLYIAAQVSHVCLQKMKVT